MSPCVPTPHSWGPGRHASMSRSGQPFTQLWPCGFGRGPSQPTGHHAVPTVSCHATCRVFTASFHPGNMPGGTLCYLPLLTGSLQGCSSPARAHSSRVPPTEWAQECPLYCTSMPPRSVPSHSDWHNAWGSPQPEATRLVCGGAGLAHEALAVPVPRLGPAGRTAGVGRCQGWPGPPCLAPQPRHRQRPQPLSWLLGAWPPAAGLKGMGALPPGLPPHLLHDGPAHPGRSALGTAARDRAALVWASPAPAQAPTLLPTTSSSVGPLAAAPPGWLCPCTPPLPPSREGRAIPSSLSLIPLPPEAWWLPLSTGLRQLPSPSSRLPPCYQAPPPPALVGRCHPTLKPTRPRPASPCVTLGTRLHLSGPVTPSVNWGCVGSWGTEVCKSFKRPL